MIILSQPLQTICHQINLISFIKAVYLRVLNSYTQVAFHLISKAHKKGTREENLIFIPKLSVSDYKGLSIYRIKMESSNYIYLAINLNPQIRF